MKERQTDTWDNEKMKSELPQVGFEPTTLCTPYRCSYHVHVHLQVHVCVPWSDAIYNIKLCHQICKKGLFLKEWYVYLQLLITLPFCTGSQ